jgi:hypothetical protein
LQLVKTVAHPKIVEERLGHSTVVIAMDLYSPLMDGMETSAAEQIDEAFMIAKSSGSYCSISVASGCSG